MSNILNVVAQQVIEKQEKGEEVQIIDVREPEEVAAGMIPGAKHIRLAELPQRMHEIDPNKEAIIVCRSGNRSGMACEYLMDQGYKQVKNLLGGMNGWTGKVI
ncbi:rhodanese-like domain-containing protein [Aneurinibacillus sp. BA2021]|nr:rhodanese-like domain-containing protein [Aneurinibacillus sp. BA2021]